MIKPLIHSMIVCPDMDKHYPRIAYGEGVYLYDEDGKEYIDASGGSAAVSNIGHGNEELAAKIMEQTSKISVLPTHAFHSTIVEEYLSKLVAFAPPGFTKAWTAMSGSEGVENALKLALQYHRLRGEESRYKIISRWGSYHGNSVFTLDVGGMKLRRQMYGKWMNNFPHIQPAYAYRKPEEMSLHEYSSQCSGELEDMILAEGPENVAAFIAEPVVAAALGAVPPPDMNYFKEIRRICSKYGVLFIADEILTGFGRLGTNFGMQSFNVVPDIIAAGKGISGGYYPFSAVLIHESVARPFEKTKTPFLGGHTFSCNPVAATVGNFVIDFMNNKGITQHAAAMGDVLLRKLERLKKYDIIGDVRGVGLLVGIEIVSDKITKLPFQKELTLSKKIGEKAIQNGVVLYPGGGSFDGNLGDHIMITPPLIIDEDQLERIVYVLDQSIKDVIAELKLVR